MRTINDVITGHDLATELMRLSEELDAAHDRTVDAGHEYAEAEYEYARQYAIACRAAEGETGTANTKKALADDACKEQKKRKTLADLNRQSCRDAETNLRQQISALQTVAQTVKSEIEMGGRGRA